MLSWGDDRSKNFEYVRPKLLCIMHYAYASRANAFTYTIFSYSCEHASRITFHARVWIPSLLCSAAFSCDAGFSCNVLKCPIHDNRNTSDTCISDNNYLSTLCDICDQYCMF